MADNEAVVMQGVLAKKGHFRRNWLERYFVLTAKELKYYKRQSSSGEWATDDSGLRATIEVSTIIDVKIANHHTRTNVFKIVVHDQKKDKYIDYYFDAPTPEEKSKWMRAINSHLVKEDKDEEVKKEKFVAAMQDLKSEVPELHKLMEDFLVSNSENEILDILSKVRELTLETYPKNELARKVVSMAAERKIKQHPDLWTPPVKTGYASLVWDYKVSEREQERRAKFLQENAARLKKEKGVPASSEVATGLADVKITLDNPKADQPATGAGPVEPTTSRSPADADDQLQPKIPVHKPGETCRSVYKLGNTLGSGASSIVRAGKHITTSQEVAIKCIRRKGLKPSEEQALKQEVDIMRKLNHPNLVRLIDYFEEPEWHYLVTPMCTGGELFDELVKREFYSEDDARRVIRKLASAVAYLHSQGIVHRDIKPENILLATKEANSDIMIADFGFAKSLEKNQQGTACGTPGYIAPEIVKGKAYGPVVDCWSIGVVLYILLCGYPPFPGDNHAEILKRVASGQYEFDSPYWDEVSEGAKDLVRRLLTLDPEKRMKASEILEHEWIQADEARTLSNVLTEMRKFNAKEKFKAGINTVRSAIRMKKMIQAHKDGDGALQTSDNDSPMSESMADSPSNFSGH